jgi:hypothetical protein
MLGAPSKAAEFLDSDLIAKIRKALPTGSTGSGID